MNLIAHFKPSATKSWLKNFEFSKDLDELARAAKTFLEHLIIPVKRKTVVRNWVSQSRSGSILRRLDSDAQQQIREWYEDRSQALDIDMPLGDQMYGFVRIALFDLKTEGVCSFEELLSAHSVILEEEIEQIALLLASR